MFRTFKSSSFVRFVSIMCVWLMVLSCVPLFPLSINTAHAASLVNGDFETGDLTGWNVTTGSLPPNAAGLSYFDLNKQGNYYLSTGRIVDRWSVSGGKLLVNQAAPGGDLNALYHAPLATADTTTEADITVVDGWAAGLLVRSDLNKWYAYGVFINPVIDVVQVIKYPWMGESSKLAEQAYSFDHSVAYRLKVESYRTVAGVVVKVYVNGTPVIDYTDTANTLSAEKVQPNGLHAGFLANGSRASFDNFVVKDYNTSTTLYSDSFSSDTLADYKLWPLNVQVTDDTFVGRVQSDTFTINANYISLRVGGMNDPNHTYVALMRSSDNTMLYKETGGNTEFMTPKLWDVAEYIGEDCYIMIVDERSDSRAHLNVDAIRLTNHIPLETDVSMLVSQIGYHPNGPKTVVLRSAKATPANNPAGKAFQLKNNAGAVVYSGAVQHWGEKWGSYWWVLDFSSYADSGANYRIHVADAGGDLVSTPFDIGDTVLSDNSLITTALDQLEHRKQAGMYGWRDSGSELRELTSMTIAVEALADMKEYLFDRLTAADQARLLAEIEFGADYILQTQQTTTDPQTNGRFAHDLYDNPWSANFLYTWHDAAVAVGALARAYTALHPTNPAKAAEYLAAAEKGYAMLAARPYNLPSEIDIDGTGQGLLFQGIAARDEYYMPDRSWEFPMELRTKEKLEFIRTATLLYDITANTAYRDKAVEFADDVSGQQFTDFTNPIDGAYGTFYEFEDDTSAMTKEWMQNMGVMLGNIQPTNLEGIVNLLRIDPDNPKAAKWYNIIRSYGEHYAKTTAELSPFGIYPVAAYNDPAYRGVRFFQTISHGATSLYGSMAKHLLTIGNTLNDHTYQRLAENNLQFVVGLNPGIPNAYEESAWISQSLLKGIGHQYFSPIGSLADSPAGSGVNGFSASRQFLVETINKVPDAPKGILNWDGTYQFNEDYLPHSHTYISGLSKLESPFAFQVHTSDNGVPVSAAVTVNLPEAYSFTTDSLGNLTVTSLPVAKSGTVTFTYAGQSIVRQLDTLSSGSVAWNIDFADDISVALHVPASIQTGETKAGTVSVTNHGHSGATVTVAVYADGVQLSTTGAVLSIGAGATQSSAFTVTPGEKTMPYLVYAKAATTYSSAAAVGHGNNRAVLTAAPTAVTLNRAAASVYVGGKISLLPTVAPANADPYVTWSSSDPAVAAVDTNGAVTGVSEGMATITATAGAVSATSYVTVKIVQDAFDNDDFIYEWSKHGTANWSVNPGYLQASALNGSWQAVNDMVQAADFAFSGDLKLTSGQAVGLSFRLDDTGARGYDVMLDRAESVLKLTSREGGVLGSYSLPVNLNQTYKVKVLANGPNIRVYLDGVERINIINTSFSFGKLGLNVFKGAVQIDNLLATRQLVSERFDSGNLHEWTTVGGTWSVSGNAAHSVSNAAGAAAVYKTAHWENFVYEGDVKLNSGSAAGIGFRMNDTGSEGYNVIIDQHDHGGTIKLARNPYHSLQNYNFPVVLGQTYRVRVEANGPHIKVYLDGVLRLEQTDSTYTSGKFALFGYDSHASYDNLTAAPLVLPDNFNESFGSPGLSNWRTFGAGWSNPGGYAQLVTPVNDGGLAIYNRASAADAIYTGVVKIVDGNAAGLAFRLDESGAVGYDAMIDKVENRLKLYSRPYHVLGSYYFDVALNTNYSLQIVTKGPRIDVYLNGTLRISAIDHKYYQGKFGIVGYNGTMQFDNLSAISN